MALKTITFITKDGKVIFQGKVTSLPLKEEKIINKSIELFNDCDPCIIHKTYVMKKIYLDIDDYLNDSINKGTMELKWDYLPEDIKCVLNFQKNIEEIAVTICIKLH